jgi:hypothetical protein
MRKILSITLALLLLMSTIGITIHKHYCMSTLVATSLIPSVEDACDSDMPMDKDTCKDDHQHYGVDDPLLLLSLTFDLAPSVEWIENLQILAVQDHKDNLFTSKFLADISPPPSEPDIYSKVQSFLL